MSRVAVGFLLLVGLTAAGAQTSRGSTSHTASTAGPNASRFLQLTGDANGIHVGVADGAVKADVDLESVGVEPRSGRGTADPQGWAFRPAGQQVDVLRFPLGLASSADQGTIVVSSDSGGVQGLTVINAKTLAALPDAGRQPLHGRGRHARRRRLRQRRQRRPGVPVEARRVRWPSRSTSPAANRFPIHDAFNGLLPRLGLPSVLPVGDGISVPGYPGGHGARRIDRSTSPGRPSEAARRGRSRARVDRSPAPASHDDRPRDGPRSLDRPSVGLDAFGLAIDPARHRALRLELGRRSGPRRPAPAAPCRSSTCSDPATAHEIATVGVGHHPSALQLSPDGSPSLRRRTPTTTPSRSSTSAVPTPPSISVRVRRPVAGSPVGAHPDVFALSPDGNTLFVALSGFNAVELPRRPDTRRADGRQAALHPHRLVPVHACHHGRCTSLYRLWVTQRQGPWAPGPGLNGLACSSRAAKSNGTVSAIDLPVADDQVAELDRADAGERLPRRGCLSTSVRTPLSGRPDLRGACARPPARRRRSSTSSTSSPRTRPSISTSVTST